MDRVHLPYLGIDMFVDAGDRDIAVHDSGGVRVPGPHEINRIADRRPRFYEVLVAPNGRE